MENVSKALLIAGGMLIMILVMTFAAMLFKKMGEQTSVFYKEMNDTKVSEFNQKLFNYNGASDLRFQDVVTIANYARNSNELEIAPVEIKMKIDDEYVDLKQEDADWKNWIKEKLAGDLEGENYKNRYKCKIKYAENSEYVGEIIIEKNTT